MKKLILFLGLLNITLIQTAAAADELSVDWENRLDSIENAIDQTFNVLSNKFEDGWVVSDSQLDSLFVFQMEGIDQREFFKKIIQEQYKQGQKDFYALDFGASHDFAWGQEVKNYINAQEDLPDDIKVTLIGVHGDWFETKFFKEGKCIVYQLDTLKLETIKKALHSQGLYLENKIDFITSHYTFTHLVDPIGTWMQAYDLLKPQTGIFLYDGFRIYTEEVIEDYNYQRNLVKMNAFLLYESKIPFLMSTDSSTQYFGHFLVKKTSTNKLDTPFKYVRVKEEKDPIGGSEKIYFRTVYTPKNQASQKEFLEKMTYDKDFNYWSPTYLGDKEIFDWLAKNNIIPDYVKWAPLLKE